MRKKGLKKESLEPIPAIPAMISRAAAAAAAAAFDDVDDRRLVFTLQKLSLAADGLESLPRKMLEKLQQFSALTPKPKTLTQSLREVPPARLPLSARAFNHNCNVLSLMHFFTSALNLRIICSLLNLSVIFIQKLQPLSIIFIHNLQPLSVISSTNVNRHNTRIQNPTNSFYFNAPPVPPLTALLSGQKGQTVRP
jgi:hypothetical protein